MRVLLLQLTKGNFHPGGTVDYIHTNRHKQQQNIVNFERKDAAVTFSRILVPAKGFKLCKFWFSLFAPLSLQLLQFFDHECLVYS